MQLNKQKSETARICRDGEMKNTQIDDMMYPSLSNENLANNLFRCSTFIHDLYIYSSAFESICRSTQNESPSQVSL